MRCPRYSPLLDIIGIGRVSIMVGQTARYRAELLVTTVRVRGEQPGIRLNYWLLLSG